MTLAEREILDRDEIKEQARVDARAKHDDTIQMCQRELDRKGMQISSLRDSHTQKLAEKNVVIDAHHDALAAKEEELHDLRFTTMEGNGYIRLELEKQNPAVETRLRESHRQDVETMTRRHYEDLHKAKYEAAQSVETIRSRLQAEFGDKFLELVDQAGKMEVQAKMMESVSRICRASLTVELTMIGQ